VKPSSQLTQLERRAHAAWLRDATHVHYGRCSVCERVRDEDDRPLLVARQPRRRRFECLDCWEFGA